MIYAVFVCAFLAGVLVGVNLTVRVFDGLIKKELEILKEKL